MPRTHAPGRAPKFPDVLTVDVGGRSIDELMGQMEIALDDSTRATIERLHEVASERREQVRYAEVEVRALGFKTEPTVRDVLARIQELGHSLCKPHDALYLRVAYRDQSRRPSQNPVYLAMEPVGGSCGSPGVFSLLHEVFGTYWILTESADLNMFCALTAKFMFRLDTSH